LPVPAATSKIFPDARANNLFRSRLTPRRSGTPSTTSYQRAKRSYFRAISCPLNETMANAFQRVPHDSD
jgi:hypothetical protein